MSHNGSTKPNTEVSGWPYQTKNHITHIVYQENYQSILPYFMALDSLLFFYFTPVSIIPRLGKLLDKKEVILKRKLSQKEN